MFKIFTGACAFMVALTSIFVLIGVTFTLVLAALSGALSLLFAFKAWKAWKENLTFQAWVEKLVLKRTQLEKQLKEN